MGFDAQASFGLAEQAVALRDALEGRHQVDEQDDVLWSRVRCRGELNFLLHKEKAPQLDGANTEALVQGQKETTCSAQSHQGCLGQVCFS